MELRQCASGRCDAEFEVPAAPAVAAKTKRFCSAACRAIAHREGIIAEAAVMAYRTLCEQRGGKG